MLLSVLRLAIRPCCINVISNRESSKNEVVDTHQQHGLFQSHRVRGQRKETRREKGGMQLDLVGPMFKRSRSQLWSGVKFRTFLTENAQQHTHTRKTYRRTDIYTTHTHTHSALIGRLPICGNTNALSTPLILIIP